MVQSISSSPFSQPSPGAPPPKQELGRDSFVRLLLAQLQSQDPTAPQSSQDFVAQLAQFTSVELQQRSSENLEALLMATAASNQTQASTLVGKDVVFGIDSITLENAGDPKNLAVELSGPADNVIVTITDDSGKVVRTMQVPAQDAGRVDCPFDGRADDGTPLPAGSYDVKVVALKNGKPVDAIMLARGAVTGVSFLTGVAQLLVEGEKIRLPEVIEIQESRRD